jgi:hypothetical protein
MAQDSEPAVVETMRTTTDALTTSGVSAAVLAYISRRITDLGDDAEWSPETIRWATWLCKPPIGPTPDPWPPPQPGEGFMRDATLNVMRER